MQSLERSSPEWVTPDEVGRYPNRGAAPVGIFFGRKLMKQVRRKAKNADATRIRLAKEWLDRGRPREAIAELQQLTGEAWEQLGTARVVWQAAQALG